MALASRYRCPHSRLQRSSLSYCWRHATPAWWKTHATSTGIRSRALCATVTLGSGCFGMVEAVVKQMRPMQTANSELRPGLAYCFGQFYSLIQDAVQSARLGTYARLAAIYRAKTLNVALCYFRAT